MLGAIGFETERKGLISKVIRWFTESEWSHVFIVAGKDEIDGELQVLEASMFGIRKIPMAIYTNDPNVKLALYLVRTSEERQRAALAACQDLIGRSYGYLQILGFALILPLRKLGLRIKNPISSGRVCSELALRYLQILDMDYRFRAMDRDSTSPQDLFAIIEDSPHFERIEE